jgi:hypothetical protein
MEETKAVKNEAPKEDRFTRRLKARKQEFLDACINLFFTERSSLKDPEGEEADAIYTKYRNMWIAECKEFNKQKRRPFTLRGGAFKDNIERIIEMEKTQKQKVYEENRVKDFRHWMRREATWRKMPFRHLWFYIKAGKDEKKKEQLWKNYYLIWLDKP